MFVCVVLLVHAICVCVWGRGELRTIIIIKDCAV